MLETSKIVSKSNGGDVVVGLTASTFDLLHAGHVLMLEEAKSQCDYLIVCLQTNPKLDRPSKNEPIQSTVERYIQLRACKYVDEIVPYQTEQDLEDILSSMHIDVRILGIEYKDREFTGSEICKKRGITTYFNKRDHRFSSSSLRNQVFERESNELPCEKSEFPPGVDMSQIDSSDVETRLKQIIVAANKLHNGDKEKANIWLNRSKISIGDAGLKRPLEMIYSEEDTNALLDYIGRLENGIVT